jgi:hypothetical protein
MTKILNTVKAALLGAALLFVGLSVAPQLAKADILIVVTCDGSQNLCVSDQRGDFPINYTPEGTSASSPRPSIDRPC